MLRARRVELLLVSYFVSSNDVDALQKVRILASVRIFCFC